MGEAGGRGQGKEKGRGRRGGQEGRLYGCGSMGFSNAGEEKWGMNLMVCLIRVS
jgi:hypothetical protein